MAVTSNGKSSAKIDFTEALHKQVPVGTAKKSAENTNKNIVAEPTATSTIEFTQKESEPIETGATANGSLAELVAKKAKKKKKEKKKIGGYVPESLYDAAHAKADEQGIGISALLEVLLYEYVYGSDTKK